MEEIKKEAESFIADFAIYDWNDKTGYEQNMIETKKYVLKIINKIQEAIDWHEYEYPNETFYYWNKVKQYIKDNY
jgi:hypothetical protein